MKGPVMSVLAFDKVTSAFYRAIKQGCLKKISSIYNIFVSFQGNILRQKEESPKNFIRGRKEKKNKSRNRRVKQKDRGWVVPSTISSAFPQQRRVISPHQLINTCGGSCGCVTRRGPRTSFNRGDSQLHKQTESLNEKPWLDPFCVYMSLSI